MNPADFHFDLPEALIAQAPLPDRAGSRLLVLRPDGGLDDAHFPALTGLLRPGDLLVLNDTRVIPARLHGTKASGGRIELLVERVLDTHAALVQLRSSHAPKPGAMLEFEAGVTAEVLERRDEFFVLRFSWPVDQVLASRGHIPLPPYIRRPDEAPDRERYQTVYARQPGSVAAPTAGLHFDPTLLGAIRARGVDIAHLTLHVGAGTFQPVRERQLAAGRLHPERCTVGAEVCEAVAACRARGGRVVAVGTTSVRALESAARATPEGPLAPWAGETDLFIRPGFTFRVVDALVTNFHLPESSLLMLVCAFGGRERVLAAYAHAVEARYRFYSYGDAMFLDRAIAP